MGQNKELNFTSYIRPALFKDATYKDGRLNREIEIHISDNYSSGDINPSGVLDVSFIAAKDIAGLNPAAIKHMAPAPHTINAETTKLVHIDFWDTGLPWRYTSEVSTDDKQKPWLVLLVGTTEEINVEKGIVTFVADKVLLEHDLKDVHLWAHVQSDGKTTFSRIISPRGIAQNGDKSLEYLKPQQNYIAVLVPAFCDNEEDNWMWRIDKNKVKKNFSVLPAFHSWTFKTDEKGDFLTLAKALKPAEKNTGKIGKAKLYYKRQYYQNGNPIDPEINESMEIGGAITSIIETEPTNEQLGKVMQDVNGLKKHIPAAINLPDYGRPWLPNPDAVTKGWPAQINKDPRFRGITGIGTWMGIEAQEVLMDAAVKQVGALREAGQRIGYLALGLLASGRLWGKRMPTDENERLRILGPMMSRMLAKDGGIILDRVTNDTSPLSKAIFSGAAQRVLKQAKGKLKYLNKNEKGSYYSQFLNQANTISLESEEIPKGLPHIENMGLSLEDFFKIQYKELRDIWCEIVRISKEFFSQFINLDSLYFEKWEERDFAEIKNKYFHYINDFLLQKFNFECWNSDYVLKIMGGRSFEKALQENIYFNKLLTELWYAIVLCKSNLERCWIACRKFNASNNSPITSVLKHRFPNWPDRPKIPEDFCEDFIRQAFPPPIIPKKSINLRALSDIIFKALDPRQDNPPALRRICSRIKINGESPVDCKKLVRPEYPIGLDFPTWTLLKDKDQEWFLPGVNNMEKDSVIALQTNPAFVDAYMLGLNSQFLGEMRWRDMAVDLNCTPLRMFWGQVNNKTKKREADIEPLATWTDDLTALLGDASHQTMHKYDSLKEGEEDGGNNLVLVFRTDLFRRYPNTLVYLVKPEEEGANNEKMENAELARIKKLLTAPPQLDKDGDVADSRFFKPVFIGSINPEITFFIFNVKPNELEKYWVLLDEPPTELRFRNDVNPSDSNVGTSAQCAKALLNLPIRVAIEGKKLSPENESQL